MIALHEGSWKGDAEWGKYSELLPGIKDYEIHLKFPHSQNILRGMLTLDTWAYDPYQQISLQALILRITLLSQYTKLSHIPPVPTYFPALDYEHFKTISPVIGNLGDEDFDFGLLRLRRIPKYLIIYSQIQKCSKICAKPD